MRMTAAAAAFVITACPAVFAERKVPAQSVAFAAKA